MMNLYNKKYFALWCAAIGCIIFTSCNPAKKAIRQERKAFKHIQKAEAIQPNELAKWCADRYKSIDSIHEVYFSDTTYLPGEIHFVEVDCDSARLAHKSLHDGETSKKSLRIKIPCPPCDSSRIINTFKSRFQTESNKAALDSMSAFWGKKVAAKDAEIKNQDKEIATLKQQKKTWRSIAFILGIAWVLFFVWKFVKSKFKIL